MTFEQADHLIRVLSIIGVLIFGIFLQSVVSMVVICVTITRVVEQAARK